MRIDTAGMIPIKTEAAELLKEVETGDTIKGKVLETIGNSIAIRTAGGQIISAILQEGTKVPRGIFVELLVNSITDGKIYAELKTDSKNIDMDMKLAELLKKLNLPVDEKNIDAAKLLIKYKLPLDRESITNITGFQKSLENLSQSSEGRTALLLSGLDIKNTPVEVLNKIVLNWPSELESQKIEEMIRVKATDTEGSAALIENAADRVADTGKSVRQGLVTEADTEESIVYTKEQQSSIKPSILETGKAPGKAVEGESHNASEQAEKIVSDNNGTDMLRALDKLGVKSGIQAAELAGKVASVLASLKGADMEAITYMVSKEIEITPKNLGMLLRNIENSDGISQLLDKVRQRIADEDSPELKEIRESVRSIFMNPEEIEDAKEVTEKLKDIARLGEKLENYLNRSDNKDPELRNALSNLRDNIDFIRSINQHANYLQIPVMINGEASTAKLYVFKDGKRNRKINPEDATIVVALDLRSLGHLESMIKVKDKNVSVTFKVEDKGIGSILEKHGSQLKDMLKEKGYSLSPIRILSLDQTFSVLSLETMMNESNTDKIHFDMRV